MSRTRTPHVRSGQLLAGRHTLNHIVGLRVHALLRGEESGLRRKEPGLYFTVMVIFFDIIGGFLKQTSGD